MNPEYSSKFYFRPAQQAKEIDYARYVHRARSVKHNDPQGVYATFNLSNNQQASDKPTIHKEWR